MDDRMYICRVGFVSVAHPAGQGLMVSLRLIGNLFGKTKPSSHTASTRRAAQLYSTDVVFALHPKCLLRSQCLPDHLRAWECECACQGKAKGAT